ncbi:Peptide chain release factor subunit 1 [uncultured archaeon]|nr:Peptide chain release factor subunit 1 [uncultured archaeon]
MADILESSSSDEAVFRKKLKKLEKFQGHGTELISVYIPEDTDRGAVMNQLTSELSQSSNIKSPSTRKNVQGALRKITGFLKQINFNIPSNGLVVFSGNISETEGRTDIRLFTVRPVKDLRTKLYWCDSRFHLEPLKDMLKPTSVYGLVTIDHNEATIATLIGKRYEIMGKFTSGYSGKSRAGGQSSQRFQRLREEAEQDFYKRISEKCNMVFLPFGDKFAGLIVGGPGMTKQFFLDKDMLDHRIKKNILGMLDTSYTDEGGIREMMQKSEQILKDTDVMRERAIVNDFLGELAKDGLAAYGEKEVMEALERGQVAKLLVSEGIEWLVFRISNEKTGEVKEVMDKDGKFKIDNYPDFEILEEMDFLDFMTEKANQKGTELAVVSKDSDEGEQFYSGFGGIGAMLRYKL